MNRINRNLPGITIALVLGAFIAKATGIWPDAKGEAATPTEQTDEYVDDDADGNYDLDDYYPDEADAPNLDAGTTDGTSDAAPDADNAAEEAYDFRNGYLIPPPWEHPDEPMGPEDCEDGAMILEIWELVPIDPTQDPNDFLGDDGCLCPEEAENPPVS